MTDVLMSDLLFLVQSFGLLLLSMHAVRVNKRLDELERVNAERWIVNARGIAILHSEQEAS
jgi:hypothetical protein